MDLVVNRYDLRIDVAPEDSPPVPGAFLKMRPFGVPPRELREIWTIKIDDLESVLRIIYDQVVEVELSLSEYWSGKAIDKPGERLFGIALTDEFDIPEDPSKKPAAF